jgi:hypothetical protein
MPRSVFPAFAGAASRLRAEALRRASAQAGRHLAVLTYSFVGSARPSPLRPSLREASGEDWARPFGQTQGMLFEHSKIFQGCILIPHGW